MASGCSLLDPFGWFRREAQERYGVAYPQIESRGIVGINRGIGAALLVGFALSGCGPNVEKTISSDELEQGIVDAFKDAGRPEPEKVECPGSVEAEMAEKTECVMTQDGRRYHVAVVVTTIKEDGTAEYDIEIDEKPMH